MSDDQVAIELGPVERDLAVAWIEHCQQLVRAVDRHVGSLSVRLNPPLLELLDTVLGVWGSAAQRGGPTFEWTFRTSADQLIQVINEWLSVGSLSEEDLAIVGVGWAPDWTRPMSDAVVTAVVSALDGVGAAGDGLRRRLLGAD